MEKRTPSVTHRSVSAQNTKQQMYKSLLDALHVLFFFSLSLCFPTPQRRETTKTATPNKQQGEAAKRVPHSTIFMLSSSSFISTQRVSSGLENVIYKGYLFPEVKHKKEEGTPPSRRRRRRHVEETMTASATDTEIMKKALTWPNGAQSALNYIRRVYVRIGKKDPSFDLPSPALLPSIIGRYTRISQCCPKLLSFSFLKCLYQLVCCCCSFFSFL